MVLISYENLKNICSDIMSKAGLKKEDAQIVGDALATADLRGIGSHGLLRLPFYAKRAKEGGINTNYKISHEKDSAAIALLDGDDGPGHVVAVYAMKLAIDKAKGAGIGFVGVRNSDHFGANSYYSMLALNQNMIGMVWTNGSANMAAWGGAESIICNNPLSIAIPAFDETDIVVDFAMSTVAGGKVRLAAKKGEKCPLDWIIDKDGCKTDNPNALAEGGAVLPLTHKGYGLAIAGELLTGVLTNSGTSVLGNVLNWMTYPSIPTKTSHTFIAIDISFFREINEFKREVDEVIRRLRNSKKAQDCSRIYTPGEPENDITKKHLKEGIMIADEVFKDILKLAEEYEIEINIESLIK